MKLSDWAEKTGTRPGAIAAALGVSPSTVSRFLTGERIPKSPQIIAAIEKLTKGKVSLSDWLT